MIKPTGYSTPRARRILRLLASILLAMTCCAPPAHASIDLQTTFGLMKPLQIAVIGDSYSAGNGAGYYEDLTSRRSALSWGNLYSQYLLSKGISNKFVSHAVSGATTGDIKYQAENDLAPNTDLVLLTAGGNDVNFEQLIKDCYSQAGNNDKCKSGVESAEKQLDTVITNTVGIFDKIKPKLSATGEIVLVGYPQLNYWDASLSEDDTRTRLYKLLKNAQTKQEAMVKSWNAFYGSPRVSYVKTMSEFSEHWAQRLSPVGGLVGESSNTKRWLNEFCESMGTTKGILDAANEGKYKDYRTPFTFMDAFFNEDDPVYSPHQYKINVDLSDHFNISNIHGDPCNVSAYLSPNHDKTDWMHPNIAGQFAITQAIIKQYSIQPMVSKHVTETKSLTGTPNIDIAWVVDATGSMADEISTVKDEIKQISNFVAKTAKSYRFSFITYRDHEDYGGSPGDYTSKLIQPFTSDLDTFHNSVDSVVVDGGGGDGAGTVYSGMMTGFNRLDWRPGVRKVMIVLGDVPPKDPEPVTGYTASDIIQRSFEIDPVEVYGINRGDLGSDLAYIAKETGGKIFDSDSAAATVESFKSIITDTQSKPLAWLQGPIIGYTKEAVTLDSRASMSGDRSPIVKYEWDFDGDGTYDEVSNSGVIRHRYNYPFTGFAGVRITTKNGASAVGSAPVRIDFESYDQPKSLTMISRAIAGDTSEVPDDSNTFGGYSEIKPDLSERLAKLSSDAYGSAQASSSKVGITSSENGGIKWDLGFIDFAIAMVYKLINLVRALTGLAQVVENAR